MHPTFRFGGDKHRTDDSSHREYADYRLFALLYPLYGNGLRSISPGASGVSPVRLLLFALLETAASPTFTPQTGAHSLLLLYHCHNERLLYATLFNRRYGRRRSHRYQYQICHRRELATLGRYVVALKDKHIANSLTAKELRSMPQEIRTSIL